MSPSSPLSSAEPAAAAVLEPVLEFLIQHAPFDRMNPADLRFLAERLSLGFHPGGEVIADPGWGPADIFYIIKQGRVRGEAGESDEAGAWELGAGEGFPIGALLARRPVRTVNRAVEDTFCFELKRADFDALLARSPVFHDFCTRRLANLLDQALRRTQAGLAGEVSGVAAMSVPLGELVRRAPVACPADTPIRLALERMQAERVGSMVVTDAQGGPAGIFTLRDLLARIVLSDAGLQAPIAEVMSKHVQALSPRATAHDAALLMAQRGIGHVCLVEGGRLAGVVSERDLFSLQRIGLVSLSRDIQRAADIEVLARLARDIQRLIDPMLVQGVSVTQLSQIITLLNDHVTRRAIELVLAGGETRLPAFTWLAFGSEGREEQTLKTDQDNGIVFVPPSGMTAGTVRDALLPVARRINAALDRCGYPLCTGNIMAGNPECCLSLDEWRARYAAWIEQGTPEHLLKASIFFDFRPLWGDPAPAAALRGGVTARAAGNPRFLRQMAENALRNSPPLGLVREFVVESTGEHAHQLDLKLRGATPFVDGARLLALAHRIDDSNTAGRLRAAGRAGVLPAAEAEAWCDALSFIQMLRMRGHQAQARAGVSLHNHIDPDGLNELDRRILKEAFRQARKLQARIALDYQL